ncbi:hypothetical protein FAM09_29110 [Niastella caeni]|uniref:Uncharacterized protein n=1 Tax=Niastella caeni TaxID=2569763 RepID=A0A4S8HCM1_9BACT|nr:hypothetical protein [Niastella caeni]THU31144.1 hypothetical protein FAM09_29110 [Niastella caeni]
MKKIFFVLLALPIFAFKCSKKNTRDGYLEGKVIRASCASLVVQVLNDDTVGEDGWKDMKNNNAVYDNVFSVTNACKVADKLSAGTTFYFKVTQPVPNDCVYCMMFDAPPNAKYDITDISVTGK